MSANSEQTLESIDCTRASEEIRTFAGARMPAKRARVLRAHLLECADCNQIYRASVETAARLGHNLRADREDLESEEAEIRRAAYRSIDKVRAKKPNHFALRTILIPAFFFFLMVFVAKESWPGDEVEVTDFGGAVFVEQDSFLPDGPPRKIVRGCWLTTSERAFAEFETGPTSVRMEELTFFLVEEPATHRFRLRSGEIEIEGPSQVTTTRGVLEIEEGRARFSFRDGALEIVCQEGQVSFIEATGESHLSVGEKLLRGVR